MRKEQSDAFRNSLEISRNWTWTPKQEGKKKRGQFYNIDQIILHNGSNRRSWSNLSKLILYLRKKKVGKKEKEKDDVDSEKLI